MAKKKEKKKPTPSRLGKQAQGMFGNQSGRRDVFSHPAREPEQEQPKQPIQIPGAEETTRGPGRPKKFDDNKKKTTVSFQLEQIVWLDRLCTDILSNTKNVIDRGDIIRACVEALHESGIDLSHVTSPESIKEIIFSKLRAK